LYPNPGGVAEATGWFGQGSPAVGTECASDGIVSPEKTEAATGPKEFRTTTAPGYRVVKLLDLRSLTT